MKIIKPILLHVIALIFVINANAQVPIIVQDFDGNTYQVVDLTAGLDTLYFTKTSMIATHYSDGTPIDANYWGRATTPENNLFYKYAYSAFVGMAGLTDGHSDPAKVNAFNDFSNMQGPCPDGWRIPRQSDWEKVLARGVDLQSLNMTDAVDGESASGTFVPPDFNNGDGSWTGWAVADENPNDNMKAIHLEYTPGNAAPNFNNWVSKATNPNNPWGFLSVRCIRTAMPLSPVSGSIVIQKTGSGFIATDMENGNGILYESSSADDLFQTTFAMIKEKGTIFIEEGEYQISNSLKLKSGITIIGVNNPVIRKKTGGDIIIGTNVSDVVLKKLTFKGDINQPIFSRGILIGGFSEHIQIDSCVIDSVSGDGIVLESNNCMFIDITNSTITNCKGGGGIALSARYCLIKGNIVKYTRYHTIIVTQGGSNHKIIGNYVEGSGKFRKTSDDFCHGIAIDGASGTRPGYNNQVLGNEIINPGMAGIEIADGQDSVIVRDNIIRNSGYLNVGWDYGIAFGGGFATNVCAEIVNNKIYKPRGTGIAIECASGDYVEDVRIDSNYLENGAMEGIFIGAAKDITVNYNEIKGFALNGIVITKNNQSHIIPTNIIITNNIVSGSKSYGLSLDGGNNITIKDNNFCSNTLGGLIRVSAALNLFINNNNCALDFSNTLGITKEPEMKIISGARGVYKIEGLNSQRTTLTVVDMMGRKIFSRQYDKTEPIEFSLPSAKQIYLVNLYNENGEILFSNKLLKIDE